MTTIASTPGARRIMENDRQIAQYATTSAQAFYAAESGVEEARARLRTYAGLYRIVDHAPHDPQWGIAIDTRREKQEPRQGLPSYAHVPSLQNDLTYTVTIRHATDPATAAVLRWGNAHGEGVPARNTMRGENIYVITAHGEQGEARHTIEVEATPEPAPTVPAALYVAGPLHLEGGRTHIIGTDSCGDQHQAGVRTTLPASPVESQPELTSAMASAIMIGAPPRVYQSTPIPVPAMLETLKERATVVYAPITAASAAPGAQWGVPRMGATLQAPSTCEERQIVHYHTHGTPGYLPSGTSGCGVLLIEGDVEIQGDFTWNGAILATGSLRLTGGGTKQVTGGMAVAGSVTVEDGGETSLVYCSEAIVQQTRYLPLRILSWRDNIATAY
jgi:hypothetical protein